MAIGIGEPGRKFIETEPIGKDGEQCEGKVWQAIKEAFSERDCIGYWLYPIFSKTGETRKEPDIMIADKELGIIIIEVKCITIDQIVAVNGHKWEFQDFYETHGSPYKQAENQLYALLGYCDREEDIRRRVIGRAMVALPLITEKEWQAKGFDRLPGCPPIIFKDQLGEVTLLKRIQQTTPVVSGKPLEDSSWELLLAVIGGTPVMRKPRREATAIAKQGKTRSGILNSLRDRLYELDLQQENIAKQIAPGTQRIRGIAGSGKTVLLCQKAAHMHLKHPDWDIALVFFTRSLYNQIEALVDHWLKHFSQGDTQYSRDNKKLQVLHAWGANDQPGLYGTICEKHGIRRLTVKHTNYRQPNEGLADLCKRLLENTEIQPMFDAVLIDEGQDLVVDGEKLKHKGKQAIYWMAYESVRPFDPEHPEQKRLIWAYDEAQSLYGSSIPNYEQVFGESLGETLSGEKSGPIYKGGAKKNEVMQRCYRTPGPILTAAHAIGMGFLSPKGMLLEMNRKRREELEDIGYEVTANLRKKTTEIKIHRPPKNSPNLVPQLWGESVISFDTYDSRQEELGSLCQHIKHNLEYDGLQPSREILVLVLGSINEGIALETDVANFLMERGIDIFIPSGVRLNQLKPRWGENDPNNFWYPGGVTVARIHRAKGNEADMVYVVGLDNIAKCERDIKCRNQLFVAMSRSRGWVRLSGIGNYPMYDEMRRVIDSGDTFTFMYNRDPERNVGDEEVEPPEDLSAMPF